ncbi:hypothetical protein ACE38V_11365 [Cytobacillus sp. Hz8]|uniref:hypothetical protein n=1 Tax=Cytobacillus sp. Hz8 TaxID=3347168 RepID=UPI0035D80F93
MSKENKWIVHFLNEATDEQILNLFQTGIEDSVREDIEGLLLGRKNRQSEINLE